MPIAKVAKKRRGNNNDDNDDDASASPRCSRPTQKGRVGLRGNRHGMDGDARARMLELVMQMVSNQEAETAVALANARLRHEEAKVRQHKAALRADESTRRMEMETKHDEQRPEVHARTMKVLNAVARRLMGR